MHKDVDETLLSHKGKQMWISWTEVDELKACCIEWSNSEREKEVSYINAYIWGNGIDEAICRAVI